MWWLRSAVVARWQRIFTLCYSRAVCIRSIQNYSSRIHLKNEPQYTEFNDVSFFDALKGLLSLCWEGNMEMHFLCPPPQREQLWQKPSLLDRVVRRRAASRILRQWKRWQWEFIWGRFQHRERGPCPRPLWLRGPGTGWALLQSRYVSQTQGFWLYHGGGDGPKSPTLSSPLFWHSHGK